TASEVALLAISAGAAASYMPLIAVLTLPVIFAAGMSLMDTADGAFMSKAYAWAFANPIRKVFYNMTVTGLSVFVALFVGVVELTQILIGKLGLRGPFWDQVGGLDFSRMGFIIVAAFFATWIAAADIFRLRREQEVVHELEQHLEAMHRFKPIRTDVVVVGVCDGCARSGGRTRPRRRTVEHAHY